MNRNFLITGAAQGIGLQLTRRALLGNGRVVMTDLSKEEGEKAAINLGKEFGTDKVCFIHLDVRDAEMWKSVWDEAEKFFGGQVEVLMNNAGVFSRTDWKLMLDVNMGGLATGTMLAMERMGISNGGYGGLVFQTASLASLTSGGFTTPTEEMYTATKWGILGWTRSMTRQSVWLKEKVKVMAVCPWLVDTGLVRAGMANISEEEKKRKTNSWIHRMIQPEDVALAVEQAIVNGESGDVITVGPGIVYYYPDIQKAVFLLYKVVHTLLVSVGWVPRSKAVTTDQIFCVMLILVFAVMILFHFLLSWMGF